jgi:hypothetical protein
MGNVNMKASDVLGAAEEAFSEAGVEEPSKAQLRALLEDEGVEMPEGPGEAVEEYFESGHDGSARFESTEWEDFKESLTEVAEKHAEGL